MNVPEQIVAVGETGKAIAYDVLESDWFVDEILRPQPEPHAVSVTIVETVSDIDGADRERLRGIRQRIDERQRSHRTATEPTGDLTVEYHPIPARSGLENEVRWLREEQTGPATRGLEKARYMATRGQRETDIFSKTEPGAEVAVIAGLGTAASGMLPDIAEALRERPRASVTLFGLLPTRAAGEREQANAFATLSELEAAVLDERALFDERIIFPPGPEPPDTSGYGPDFAASIAYALCAYYNRPDGIFAGTPQYAPFVLGTTQLLRYEVERAESTRKQARTLLEEKQDVIRQEKALYDGVESVLAAYEQPDESATLRTLDRIQLRRRFEQIEDWASIDLFETLGYQSTEMLSTALAETAETDTLSERIASCSESVSVPQNAVDDIDELLAEVLVAELETLDRRRILLEQLRGVEETPVREALEWLLCSATTEAGADEWIETLETRRRELRDRHGDLSATLEETIATLEARLEERSGEVEQQIATWMRGVEDDIHALGALEPDRLQSTLSTVDRRLDRFAYAVTNSVDASELDAAPSDELLEATDELARLLRSAGLDGTTLPRAIADSARRLIDAKRAFISIHKQGAVAGKIAQWREEIADDETTPRARYREYRQQLHEYGVFEIGSPEQAFEVTISYDSGRVFQQCQERTETLRATVVTELREYVDELPQQHHDSLRSELERDRPEIDAVRDIVGRAIRTELGEGAEMELRKAELESRIIETDEQLETYTDVLECLRSFNEKRETVVESTRHFDDQFASFRSDTRRDERGPHVETLLPDDAFRAASRPNLSASGLLTDTTERTQLERALADVAERAGESQYNGLYQQTVSESGTADCDPAVCVATVSQAADAIDTHGFDTATLFADEIGAGMSDAEHWTVEAGGEWDVAVPVFLNGVVFDNIRDAIRTAGYYQSYETRAEELGREMRHYHSYRLEDGEFVRRDGFLNLADDHDAEFYQREEATVVDDLREKLLEVVRFD